MVGSQLPEASRAIGKNRCTHRHTKPRNLRVIKRFDFATLENSLQIILLKNMAARHGYRAAMTVYDAPAGQRYKTLLPGGSPPHLAEPSAMVLPGPAWCDGTAGHGTHGALDPEAGINMHNNGANYQKRKYCM